MRDFCVRFLLIAVALVAPCRAATFEAMDFERLSVESEQIFIGTVDAAFSLADGRRQIVTDFRFVDIEAIKGEPPGPQAVVRMLGGSLAGMTLTVPGAPTFRRGTRYLVFLSGNRKVMFPTLGGSQGIFEVRTNPASGRAEIYDYGGRPVSWVTDLDNTVTRQKSIVVVPAMSKDAFVGEILKRLGQPR